MDDATRGVVKDDIGESGWSQTPSTTPLETRVTADSTGSDDTDRRTREIRQEIAQTREEMSETIEAIQDRLSPGNIVSHASETVRDAASRKVHQMTNTAGNAAERVMDTSFIQTVRSNPIPAAMIGIGTAWLLMKGRSDSDRYRYSSESYRSYRGNDWRNPGGRYGTGDYSGSYGAVGTAGSEATGSGSAGYGTTGYGAAGSTGYGTTGSTGYGATGETGEYSGSGSGEYATGSGSTGYGGTEYRAGGYEGREQYGSGYGLTGSRGFGRSGSSNWSNGRAQATLDRIVRDNPLALGAAAVLVGAAIGMSVPSTEYENQFMGEARDNVVDRAREMASDAANKVTETASQVKDVASKAANAVSSDTSGSSRASGSDISGSKRTGGSDISGSKRNS